MEQTFDQALHDKLLNLLAESDYVPDYLKFCDAYKVRVDVDGPHIDMARTADIFRTTGVSLRWHKKFKVIEFDHEEIAGWTWCGKLVVQRHDGLEPMLEGKDPKTGKGVGSTMLDLAIDAGERRQPPIEIWAPLPRPQFDGDMRTMECMVPDLIALFRSVKNVIRKGWQTT